MTALSLPLSKGIWISNYTTAGGTYTIYPPGPLTTLPNNLASCATRQTPVDNLSPVDTQRIIDTSISENRQGRPGHYPR